MEKILITPRYAQKHATFISTIVSFNDTSIYFGPWSTENKLLEVPLISAGRFARNESIAIQITATIQYVKNNIGQILCSVAYSSTFCSAEHSLLVKHMYTVDCSVAWPTKLTTPITCLQCAMETDPKPVITSELSSACMGP